MWWEDEYNQIQQEKKRNHERLVADKLFEKFGLDYSDMKLLVYSDNDTWVLQDDVVNKSYISYTNDGCTHYRHIPTGKHYILDYCFRENEWREYDETKYKNIIDKAVMKNKKSVNCVIC